MRLREPALDLGIVMAIISSYKDLVIDDKTIAFGEIGLSGEVRSVSQAAVRVAEARKLGFETVILPAVSLRGVGNPEGITLKGVKTVKELYTLMMK